MEVLTEKGLATNTAAIGGMNLPLVLTAAFADADAPLAQVAQEIMEEGRGQLKPFDLDGGDEDEI